MNYFTYNKKQFHSSTGGNIYESEILISAKNAFDVIFEEIISDDQLASKGIPTRLMELFNKFVRLIEDEKLKANDKKNKIKSIIQQLIKEARNKFNNERIINAIDKIKFSQY